MLPSDGRADEGCKSYGWNELGRLSSPVFAGTPPSCEDQPGVDFVGPIATNRRLRIVLPMMALNSGVKSEIRERVDWRMNRRSDQFLYRAPAQAGA